MNDASENRDVSTAEHARAEERREFLKRYAKFAVVVPPAVTLLLASTSKRALASGTSSSSSSSTWGGSGSWDPSGWSWN